MDRYVSWRMYITTINGKAADMFFLDKEYKCIQRIANAFQFEY